MTTRLTTEMAERIAEIYAAMEEAYDTVAGTLSFSCHGCPDNCCDSYFLHHTYIEWSYLWAGMATLSEHRRDLVVARAHDHVLAAEKCLQNDKRPQVMCPLNENGLCILYRHRLMVCRTHGVPATMTRPDGMTLNFPGCFRCQEQLAGSASVAAVDRTPLLRELALLENAFLHNQRQHYPRVKMTIAEMLVKGPPALP